MLLKKKHKSNIYNISLCIHDMSSNGARTKWWLLEWRKILPSGNVVPQRRRGGGWPGVGHRPTDNVTLREHVSPRACHFRILKRLESPVTHPSLCKICFHFYIYFCFYFWATKEWQSLGGVTCRTACQIPRFCIIILLLLVKSRSGQTNEWWICERRVLF